MSAQKVTYGFIPTSISNCQVWWDGADPAGTGTPPTNGTSISSWIDKSGNGYTATASSAATYNSTYNAIYFNNNLYSSTYPANPTAETICFVFNNTNCTAPSAFISGYSGSRGVWLGDSSHQNEIGIVSTATGGWYVTGVGSITSNKTYLGGSSVNSGNGYTSYSGNPYGTGGSISFTNGTVTYLGRESGSSYGYVGYAMEIIIFNRVLSTNERQQVDGYLAQKWGLTSSLPTGHPGLTTTIYRADYRKTNIAKPIPYYLKFSPMSIAGCSLWLDGSQETSGNGTSLGTITDRSNSGNSVTASGTITVASSFLGGLKVYNFSNSRAYANNFPWQTSFTQIILVKCSSGNWLSSLWNGGYLAYVFSGNWSLEYVSGFYANDSSIAQGTSVFSSTPGGVTAWAIFVCGYQSGATSVSNYSINGTIRTSQTGPAYSGTLSTTAQLWLNGNGNGSFDTSYVAEFLHYNSILSSTQVQQIESYLAQKWGLISSLPGSHSHFTQQAGAVTTVANTKFKVVGLPRFVYASTGLVITHQDGRPWKVSGTGQGSSMGLNTGTAMSLTIYAGSDVFNSAGGRVGLFDNGNINNAVRHAGYVMWTYTFAANNFDFAWKFVSSGSGYLIYNDYPSYSSWQVSYDPSADRVLIVPPSDGKYGMVWNVTPKVSLAYVYSSY